MIKGSNSASTQREAICPSRDQVMTTVVARSDCKVSVYMHVCVGMCAYLCVCMRVHHERHFMLHICLFMQLWALPFVHVNKIVETQNEVREHLEKVHRH